MAYVVRSKNTKMFLVTENRQATWTGTRTSHFVRWTFNPNEASDLTYLSFYRPDAELRAILDNADSEPIEATFTVITVVKLLEKA